MAAEFATTFEEEAQKVSFNPQHLAKNQAEVGPKIERSPKTTSVHSLYTSKG